MQLQHVLDLISHSEMQTIRIGQRLGELLTAGDVVLLFGDFGAGKTHLIKGIVAGLGSTELVNSPSFVLINEYHAGKQKQRIPIVHADLYRIDDPAEIRTIGLEEAFGGEGVCLVEWAEHIGTLMPPTYLALHLHHLSDTKRVIRFTPYGARYEALIDALKLTVLG